MSKSVAMCNAFGNFKAHTYFFVNINFSPFENRDKQKSSEIHLLYQKTDRVFTAFQYMVCLHEMGPFFIFFFIFLQVVHVIYI